MSSKVQVNSPSLRKARLVAAGATRTRVKINRFGRSEWSGWIRCARCQKSRWTRGPNGKGPAELCLSCSGQKNIQQANAPGAKRKRGKESHLFVRGYSINDAGYKLVHLPKGHPFRGMADKLGRIREHRLIVAEHLGRALASWEVVHHKNRNKQDNRVKNLELVSTKSHALITRMEQEISTLKREITRLTDALHKQENYFGSK